MKKPILTVAIFALVITGLWIYFTGSANENNLSVTNKTAKAEKGIQFYQGSWEQAKAKAEKEGKPIFVDAYATWCGPCKVMSKRIFTQKKVGDFYNKNFINYKYDMEKGTGPKFKRKHNVSAYPTLIYFNSEGKVVKKVKGARRADGLIQLGKKALEQIES